MACGMLVSCGVGWLVVGLSVSAASCLEASGQLVSMDFSKVLSLASSPLMPV